MYEYYKLRIYPNKEQKIIINKSFRCSRFSDNYYLSLVNDNNYINANACIKDYVNNLN